MRRRGLSTILVVINVGLLLLAVAGVAIVAVRLLQQLADEQALARVTQAGTVAQQQIRETGEATHTTAQLLSERPTLQRLLQQPDPPALNTFLDQFQQTSQLDSTVVLRGTSVVAQRGEPLPIADIPTNSTYVVIEAANGQLVLAARVPITLLPNADVIGARQLDPAFATQLSTELGLPVALLGAQAARGSSADSQLRSRAIASDQLVAARLEAADQYVAVAPLRSPAGGVVGVIETVLPAASISRSVQRLIATLLGLALFLALAAGISSVVIGRRLGRPLGALTVAAARIGRGDLHSAVPIAGSYEIGTLATTFEEMRQRLVRLTDDLRQQQAAAEAIVTGIVEGVFSVDRERRIQFLNPQAAAMLGTTSSAALGRFCGDVLRPQGVNGVPPCADHCPIVHARFRGGARATEHLLLPDGQRRTVVITSAPAAEGLQVQVMRDETEIEATRRLRDTILANISHEFRTPLSAQLASIELLLDQLPELSTDQIGQLVRSQQRGTLRLTQLIDNLLESARIEAGQFTMRRQRVALDEVIEGALELIRPLLEQRNQHVAIDLPYPLPTVCGDVQRLTQVFVNLLGNANKYAPAGSTISIGGATRQATITLWVEDAGPGLPNGNSANFFGRWVRAAPNEPEQTGVGLGLWLAKSIVERHDGQIEAHSTAHGTRMQITLPVEHHHENIDR